MNCFRKHFLSCVIVLCTLTVGAEELTAKSFSTASAVADTSDVESQTFTVNGVSFKMICVEGWIFKMGSVVGEPDERPEHKVLLSTYYIGETEVTQALWQAVMGSNPSYHKGANLPVEQVSWNDCQTFITKLNELTGKKFRLPTEAEWEYAARGGKKSKDYLYSGSDTIGVMGWYDENSSFKTHEVATKAPNELGIYDMSGNVWEWCQDWYGSYLSPSGYNSSVQTNPTGPASGSDRVKRGGCCYCDYYSSRVTYRSRNVPSGTFSSIGLRLVL